MKMKKITIKIPALIFKQMQDDLNRYHTHAAERVGFLFTNSATFKDGTSVVFATAYQPVKDENYIEDRFVGAKINSSAIREAMQIMLDKRWGCFHVHLHSHGGQPSPSGIDESSLPALGVSLAKTAINQFSGYMILSNDSVFASVCTVKGKFIKPQLISIIGYPIVFIHQTQNESGHAEIFNRQSFLGINSEALFKKIRIGIIGYGGGGSHIGQQLAHIGFSKITVFDGDTIEYSNLNRLIGASFADVNKHTYKVNIAKRLIKNILPASKLVCIKDKWQNEPEELQKCDIIVASVDSYLERDQLESECRRFLIPLIDIGMDVHKPDGDPFHISGQVILSMPGRPCMKCMGFLTHSKLEEEAGKYGDAGPSAQVVWPNGVLASSAIGVLVDMITSWTRQRDRVVYLSYDGNTGVINEHIRLKFIDNKCEHFPVAETGPIDFNKL